MDEPKQTVTVTVTVQAGDTLEEIIYDLKETYDDQRDWREICAQAERDNAFGRYILPVNILFLIWRLRENET